MHRANHYDIVLLVGLIRGIFSVGYLVVSRFRLLIIIAILFDIMKIQGGFVRYFLIFLLAVLSSQVVTGDSFWIPLASNVKQSVLKSTST